jgi:hypothetical protein
MDIWESSKLVLFIAFVVPGFISLKAYELLVPRGSKDSAQQIIDAVAYSSINYAILLWPIYEIERGSLRMSWPRIYVLFYVLVLFVAPVIWACLLKWVRTTRFVQETLPHPTGKSWDYVFSQRKRYWMIVTLKDGKKIGGLYGTESFASSTPEPAQLYLQEHWVVNDDGGFERQRVDTAGIIILSADILTVELFNITLGNANDSSQKN